MSAANKIKYQSRISKKGEKGRTSDTNHELARKGRKEEHPISLFEAGRSFIDEKLHSLVPWWWTSFKICDSSKLELRVRPILTAVDLAVGGTAEHAEPESPARQ